MNILRRFVDHSSLLRCSKSESIGAIIEKKFVKDAGFGDCPMLIVFEFLDSTGKSCVGKHAGTESSYFGVKVGDRILVRYVEGEPEICAPADSLGMIMPISEPK